MAVIFYLPACERRGEELLNCMMAELSPKETETYRYFTDLRQRLQCPFPDINVAVLLCLTKDDLQEIFTLGEFLMELRIILVLPDDDTETIIKGHNLRPRYLSWLDNDVFDVVTVLKRMVDLYDNPAIGEEARDVRKIRSGHRKVPLKELTVMKGGMIRQWN